MFDYYSQNFAAIDFRERPELYRIGKGEQGVLSIEPYKGELLPHWRFKTVEAAQASSTILYAMFEAYLAAEEFPGADMARKFLQMGWTRARRYANHKGGRKYDKKNRRRAAQARRPREGRRRGRLPRALRRRPRASRISSAHVGPPREIREEVIGQDASPLHWPTVVAGFGRVTTGA